jgi:hypothetical protein
MTVNFLLSLKSNPEREGNMQNQNVCTYLTIWTHACNIDVNVFRLNTDSDKSKESKSIKWQSLTDESEMEYIFKLGIVRKIVFYGRRWSGNRPLNVPFDINLEKPLHIRHNQTWKLSLYRSVLMVHSFGIICFLLAIRFIAFWGVATFSLVDYMSIVGENVTRAACTSNSEM